ncbi:MAG: SDR family NAD(P)-dependent oxidoreductase [Planctomycetota bacterium]
MIDGKSVLITGGGGFIGSHLTEELLSMGCNVRAFVRYDKGVKSGLLGNLPKELAANLTVVGGDIRNPDAIRHAAKGVDVIFHLAAIVSIPYSYVNPREVVETNVIGTMNVLTAGKENNVGKIVHTSTSEVYGTARYVPIDEKHPLQGQSPYSASKIGADKVAESFYRSFDVPVATIRPFNQYGPRQSARAVIPTIITQALTGNTVKLGMLTPTRDFTFVRDTVEAFIAIAESQKASGEVINIGNGTEISIGDLAQKIIGVVDPNGERKISIVSEDKRKRPEKSEVNRLLADITKAKNLIGWQPRVSLDQGLKITADWISKSMDSYRPKRYEI